MAKSKSYGGLIILLLVLVGGWAGLWYYFNNRSDKQPDISTTKVARGDIIQAVTATGDLQPVVTVDVGAQVSGQIAEVMVDFNSQVKAGQVLAKIDESNAIQKVRQAEADLASAKASNELVKVNAQRTQELFEKKLVSQSELDSALAQLAQSNATLLTRNAALENAKLDLQHCTITAPIDGIVLNRNTDRGRTVNASTNAPTLFTLVNDLSKMQINAAVAEADVGTVTEGKDVRFTVDAFPNRTFTGTVRQVRNAATTSSNVVSYACIIDVNNEDLKLKPGMTANVSIIITERTNVLRVANAALRVRVPESMLPKAAATDKSGGKAPMSDDEKRRVAMEVFRDAGWQRGQPVTPDVIEKAKKAGADKGIDADTITQTADRLSQMGQRGGGGGGGDRGGGGGGRGGRNGGGGGGFAMNADNRPRTVYKLADPNAKDKKLEAVSARFGISDGVFTEVLSGLEEGDTLVTSITTPGAAPMTQPGAQNPFQGQRGFGGGGGGGGGRRGG